MKLFFLFVVGCALIIQFSSIHATNLNEYLNEKLRQSKIEFIKIHIQETSPVHEKLYKVQWNKSWRVPLTSEHRPFTINIFDEIFILDNNRVMAPSLNQTSWNKTYLALHQVDWIGELSPVKFVRNIVWEDTTYLLLCYEPDLCSLYTATRNNTLRFRHTIGHRGIPVDAKFFTQDDQLHLVIANNAGKFSVPSIIYRWSGTYMDVVDEVMTIGAISVTAFEQRRSTIIVFAQYEAENPRVGSEVYEFKGGDIERIQFLSITRPISMHHYVHGDFNFVLMTNELGRSNVLCWDGQELLHWFSLSEIEPHSLMSIFHVDGNTFIVVAHDNIIQLYKFHSTSDWKSENVKQFEDDQKIIDMVVSMNKYTMNVILIIEEKNVYLVEQWQAEMTSVPSENIVEDTDATRKCLSDLIETLQARMPAIKEAEASWKILLPSAKNLTITEPVKFDNLNFQHGTVDSIEITAEEDILPPHLIEDVLNELDHNIDEIAAGSKAQKEMIITNVEMWQDEIVIDDAYLEELEIDRVDIDIVNDAEMLSEKVILPKGNQNFTHPLRVENIIVHELEVESLCGVPSQYWMLRKDEGITFTAANSSIEYSNDTIIVHSDLTVPRLKIKSLNGTIVDELIDNLFLINHTQKIKGTITYKNFLDITNLTTQMLNGIPADKFMTTTTNQTFDDFYIPVLKIDNLFAETVNGIPIEEAARKSRKNIIKGKLKLANLHVTENFTIDVNTSMMQMFNERFLHIYENVTIFGNLHLRSIKIENAATLFVEDVPINVNDLFNNFWTKSGDQTITEKITLKNGVTIDRLDAKYLNGFTENDFLYTTMEEIPSEFTNLRFENLYVDEFFNENDYSHDSLFQVESNQLIIRKQLHLQSLRAEDIITLTFNGVDVDDIMNGIRTNFSGTTKLFTVQARRVFVDNLNIDLLNDREVLFEDGLHLNDDHQIATLKTPQFNVRKLEVERLNRIKMDLLTQLKNLTDFDLSRIVIDGDLIVKNLTVRQVDGQSMESFLEELGQSDIMITSEKSIESLIVENITLESLHGQNFDELFANVLSKSREQKISGHFSAHIVTSDNVTMNFINQQNASKFMWIDEPLTITGNVTFSDLFVEGDVITSKLNGRNVRELYDSLLHVPVKNIDFLKVDGNISWETPLTSPTSISYLWKNAVTKTGDQDITGKVTFAKDVHAWTVIGAYNEINEIERIISDAVINDGENIEISGKKFFENDFIADKLVVNGDLGIAKVNDVDILKFNDSAVRRNREETILGPLTFLKDVTIEKLHVNDADFNASINAVVRTNDVMPDNVFFEDLVVMNDVHLKNLNGIDFDEFVSNRVTLTGNHSISCDLKFNGVVTVTGNAHIGKINGIYPSEFVLNDVDEVQMIYGTKTFEDDLIVEGNVTAPQINGVDIIKEFNNGVQNDEDVNIFGNLIFKANVRIQNMNVSGLVNGVNFRSAISDSQEKANKTRQSLEESWKIIEQNIEYSSEMFENLGNIFFYLEIEENLKIPGNNVSKIDVVHFNEDEIRLNMYSEQPGIFCGLPDHCLCVYQSVVEIIDGNVRKWQVYPGEIVRNFHDPNSVFGINVITNAVSSNEKCTSSRTKQEFTTISLMKSENSKKIHEDVFDKIEGYLKDASIFKHDGNVYIILAIYYDKVSATHRTNSLLYKVHMEKRNATLVQEIPTDGAWSIQIFKINEEVFLLIGCFGESSESSLYRFNLLTQKFEQLRTFASRSRYVKSLSQGKDHFVLLDNPDTNAVNIYKYDPTSRNFHNYQNIFHVHRINGIECFYADDFGNSDVFVIVTTQGGRFYIYEYMFAGKFQMKLQHAVDDLRTMMPFYYMDRHYILIGTDNDNIIFRIVKQGPH